MSKRGRRRSSRRRKSSSSSKQSVSPYTFPKQNHRNSESCRDEAVEKGQTDSLRKENAASGCEEKERLSNEPLEEKILEQDHDVTSFQHQQSVYSRSTAVEEKGVKIVTSVSVSGMGNLPPKVVFQQSHEHFPEQQTNSSGLVTDVFTINFTGGNLKLEIQDTFGQSACSIQTTFNLMNGSRNTSETTVEHRHGRTWASDAETTSSDEICHHGNPGRNYRFTFDSRCEQTDPTDSRFPLRSCQCCGNHSLQTCPELTCCRSSDSAPRFNTDAQRRGRGSIESFWDIPPPQEFADVKYDSLEDLTGDLASFRFGACSPASKRQKLFHPSNAASSRHQFPVQMEEGDGLVLSFDQLSESDNYEPMFMRPSLSTTRSSFTKDFICCQRRQSWIRNNSIAAVEHSVCSLLRRRRQTYPGQSQSPGQMREDFSESFSSLITCLLPLQTESLRRSQQYDNEFSTFEILSSSSPQTKKSLKHFSAIPGICEGKAALLSSFCRSFSNSTLTVDGEDHTSGCSRPLDLNQSIGMEMESLDTDIYEPPDSGFDQEMREGESHSPEGLTEEGSLRGFAIQVIPPSCSSSEEHLLESFMVSQRSDINNSGQEGLVSSKSSETPQEQPKQVFPSPSQGICMEQHLQTALGNLSRSGPLNRDMNSPKTEVVTEETQPKPAEKTISSFSSQSTNDETSTLQAGTDADKPAEAASCPEKRPADAGVSVNEAVIKANKAVTIYRPSLESKEHLKPVAQKDRDGGGSDHWAKRRKLFKESKQWSSAGGSSITSDITEESVSEDTHSTDVVVQDSEERGFYTETFHSSAWIYQGDDVCSEPIRPSLTSRTRPVSIRERSVRINKGTGEYPWGFRIQFSKPIIVTEVDTNGAAEEAGLMVGDYVLAVNGIDVTSIPHSEAANLARQGPDVLTLTIGSDIARCPNTPRPPCRGYLHKRTQSSLIKGWRKRWFVLTHDCCLHYYKHKRDEGRRRALSSVKLEGADVGLDDSLGKPFVFRCRPQSGHRIYFFCATSNQEMKRWLEAMEKAIHPITQNHVWVDVTRHNSSLPPLAVKNPDCLGLLNKMDKSRDTWVQHYCILKDGCLYLYSGIRATHALGGIYLQGYMVREQPYGSKKSAIELKPPSDEFRTFYLCAENSAENKRWMISLKASIKKWLPLHQALQDYMNRLPEETRM